MNTAERNKIDLLVSLVSKAVVQRCSVKSYSEKLSQNSQETPAMKILLIE